MDWIFVLLDPITYKLAHNLPKLEIMFMNIMPPTDVNQELKLL